MIPPFGLNPITGKPGPAPKPPQSGDRKQARQRINVEVRTGYRPHPNKVPCADCGHVWKPGERRHEYDHHRGYAAEYHFEVAVRCTKCHARRGGNAKKTHCVHGHEFTPENTWIAKNGTRHCRECCRANDRRRDLHQAVRPEPEAGRAPGPPQRPLRRRPERVAGALPGPRVPEGRPVVNQPPNGGRQTPVMTPQERELWLASHRAEPIYRLLTVAELQVMTQQLRRAAVYEAEFLKAQEAARLEVKPEAKP